MYYSPKHFKTSVWHGQVDQCTDSLLNDFLMIRRGCGVDYNNTPVEVQVIVKEKAQLEAKV